MHPLGDGTGVVVRAYLHNAGQVEVVPALEKFRPRLKLERVHESGLFEGVTREANQVYAYDLLITDYQGGSRRTRDGYSFLPTLGETDLHLFNEGNDRRAYDKLGAQLRTIDGVAGVSLGHLWDRIDDLEGDARALLALYQAGRIKPHVGATFPFSRAAEAHAQLEYGRNVGKVVLTPD